MKQILFFIFLTAILISCEDEKKFEQESSTFFAGQLVGPRNNFITIEKDSKVLDTIEVKKNGKFSYNFKEETFKDGLYKFSNGNEGQIFYIEKGDSLWVHANLKDFDESIVYTGVKAEENNFLMKMYLLNDKDNELILSYYKMSPKEFERKVDSIKSERDKDFTELKEKTDFSENFLNLAKKTIAYEHYDLKERYTFLINKYFSEFRNEIPKSFFDYRKDIDLNDDELQSYYTYQRFLDNYLKNKTIERCVSNNGKNCFDINSVSSLKNRIILADSIFENKFLRDRFISPYAKKQLNYTKTEAEVDSTLSLLASIDLPKEDLENLKRIGNLQKNYFVGDNVGGLKLLNANKEKVIIKDISKKPIITFVWSVYYNYHKYQHRKVAELREKYPEFDFLTVNIDEGHTDLWLNTVENFGYNKEFEYQIRDRGMDIVLYKYFLGKILIIDDKGIIQKNGLVLNDPNFENELLSYLNQ